MYIVFIWLYVAKLTPLYKKEPLLDPNSFRMLAVIGTMYRVYAM